MIEADALAWIITLVEHDGGTIHSVPVAIAGKTAASASYCGSVQLELNLDNTHNK